MARMVPADPAHHSSAAELWMFRRLEALSDDWTVLHSLGLARHAHKPWSEIDFTLIGPLGVLLLEVKGGEVGRVDGEWQVRTADGRIESLGRGPFQQVGGAEAATRHFIEDRVEDAKTLTFGYAVATPDCRLSVDDLGVDSRLVIDARHVDESISDTIAHLFDVWANRTGRRGASTPTVAATIVTMVCADIAMAPDLRRVANDVERRMVVLTSEQQQAVQDLGETKALWLAGPAGSGKSMLAVSEVLRCHSQGLTVAYCCHTHALAEEVRARVGPLPHVVIGHRHELLRVAIHQSQTVSALIIDEAQDLMDEEWIAFADQFLAGGIADGVWRVFIDPNQNLFEPLNKAIVERWMSHRPAIQRLSRNCRTTRPISLTISALSGVPMPSGGVEDGPNPELLYIDKPAEISKLVLQRAERFASMGLDLAKLVVLTPQRFERSCLANSADRFVDFREKQTGARLRHGTVGAYKGLEATAVILVGINELSSAWSRQQLYVGCSRATTFLEVILPSTLSADVAQCYGRAALALSSSTR